MRSFFVFGHKEVFDFHQGSVLRFRHTLVEVHESQRTVNGQHEKRIGQAQGVLDAQVHFGRGERQQVENRGGQTGSESFGPAKTRFRVGYAEGARSHLLVGIYLADQRPRYRQHARGPGKQYDRVERYRDIGHGADERLVDEHDVHAEREYGQGVDAQRGQRHRSFAHSPHRQRERHTAGQLHRAEKHLEPSKQRGSCRCPKPTASPPPTHQPYVPGVVHAGFLHQVHDVRPAGRQARDQRDRVVYGGQPQWPVHRRVLDPRKRREYPGAVPLRVLRLFDGRLVVEQQLFELGDHRQRIHPAPQPAHRVYGLFVLSLGQQPNRTFRNLSGGYDS